MQTYFVCRDQHDFWAYPTKMMWNSVEVDGIRWSFCNTVVSRNQNVFNFRKVDVCIHQTCRGRQVLPDEILMFCFVFSGIRFFFV